MNKLGLGRYHREVLPRPALPRRCGSGYQFLAGTREALPRSVSPIIVDESERSMCDRSGRELILGGEPKDSVGEEWPRGGLAILITTLIARYHLHYWRRRDN